MDGVPADSIIPVYFTRPVAFSTRDPFSASGHDEDHGILQVILMNNNSSHSNESAPMQKLLYMGTVEAAFTTIVWVLILLTASIGNVLVIVAIFTHPALYIVQNFLLVSLACADILVAVLVMPFAITTTLLGEWIFGREFCLFHVTCDVLLCTASILHLVAIALDRFLAIHCPIRYAQTRNLTFVLAMIGACWIVSGLISIPPLIGWNDISENPAECGYVSEKGYIIYSSLGSFYIPLIILVTVYLTIFISARRRLRRRAGGTSPYSVTSVPVTPQVDPASIDSPDKSDAGSNCTPGNNNLQQGSAGSGWSPGSSGSHQARYLNAAAEHRRLHRKFLCFPVASRCSVCQRTQYRMAKESSLITSSFHIIQEDDFSTAASPIVDLTIPQSNPLLLSTSSSAKEMVQLQLNKRYVNSSIQASVPLPELLQNSTTTTITTSSTSASNGSVKSTNASLPPQEKSPSHLFVPKIVRPKQLTPSSSTTKNASPKSKKIPHKSQAKKQLLPDSVQCVDVKQSLAKRQKISLTKERRAARTLLIVVLVFVICWLPFFVWYLVKPFCPDCPMDERSYNFILWLGFLNSSLNPVIYTIFNLDFRKAFKRIFHRIFYKERAFY